VRIVGPVRTYFADHQDIEDQMFATEEESGPARDAPYAAYNEAVKAAYKTLADLITAYFDEYPKLYDDEVLDVPVNFWPLRDYERTLKVQKLTLHLALKTAELSQRKMADSMGLPVHTNGCGRLPAEPAPETTRGGL
jgi:hypothetical protein